LRLNVGARPVCFSAASLKSEEFLAKSILVSLLRSLDIVAKVFLSEMHRLPFVDFGNVMIDRGQRFFLFDC
jgi:hypothetical protein